MKLVNTEFSQTSPKQANAKLHMYGQKLMGRTGKTTSLGNQDHLLTFL